MMHVDPTIGRKDFEDFPRIRPLLARWGVLPEGSSKEAVAKLGVQIKRVRAVADNATGAILRQLTAHPTELLVLSTHQREGLARLTHHAVAEPLARGTHARTLFVPAGVEGFVSAETGSTNLTRVLIPIAHKPPPATGHRSCRRPGEHAGQREGPIRAGAPWEGSRFPEIHQARAPRLVVGDARRQGRSGRVNLGRGSGFRCGPDRDDDGGTYRPVRPASRKHHRTGGPWRVQSLARYSCLT